MCTTLDLKTSAAVSFFSFKSIQTTQHNQLRAEDTIWEVLGFVPSLISDKNKYYLELKTQAVLRKGQPVKSKPEQTRLTAKAKFCWISLD